MTTIPAFMNGPDLSCPRRARRVLQKAPCPPSSPHLSNPDPTRIQTAFPDQVAVIVDFSTKALQPPILLDPWTVPPPSAPNLPACDRNEVTFHPLRAITTLVRKYHMPFLSSTIPPFCPAISCPTVRMRSTRGSTLKDGRLPMGDRP